MKFNFFKKKNKITLSNSEIKIPKFLKINTRSASRRLVIPDTHGCSLTLKALLDKINVRKGDFIFFLGDFINKGIDSKGILDIIINLQESGYKIFPLRGNHEQDLIDTIEADDDILRFHKNWGIEELLDEEENLQAQYKEFLINLPYYYELEDYYLVHAGFNFEAENPFEDYEEMLWIRNFEINTSFLKSKKIVHGHSPKPLNIIKENIINSQVIALDNGAVYHEYASQGFGNLLCLNLDTMEFISQENLDYESNK